MRRLICRLHADTSQNIPQSWLDAAGLEIGVHPEDGSLCLYSKDAPSVEIKPLWDELQIHPIPLIHPIKEIPLDDLLPEKLKDVEVPEWMIEALKKYGFTQ